MRAVRERTGATAERVERTRRLLDASTLDCLVTGYEDLIGGLVLPDSNDRHVLAAAIVAGADVIVTRNLEDFPPEALGKYGIEALHPDEFLLHQLTLDPVTVCGSIRVTRAGLKNRAYSVAEYLRVLERQDLFRFVAALAPYAEEL